MPEKYTTKVGSGDFLRGERERQSAFTVIVSNYDATIRNSLIGTGVQIWGKDAAVQMQQRERSIWSPKNYDTVNQLEALWYAINRERSAEQPAIEKVAGKIQAISFEVLGVSILSLARQPLVLAMGRPQFTSILDGNELFEWEDEYRQSSTQIDEQSLEQLLQEYRAHGPSAVFRTTILFNPIEKSTARS